MDHIGARIAARRRLLGLSREKLARKADVATNTVWRIEHDMVIPTLASLIAIADALDIRASDLIDDPDEVVA